MNVDETNKLIALSTRQSDRDDDEMEFEPGPGAASCVCCNDLCSHLDVVECPCSHSYCQGCIQTLFERSFADSSLFPPRCCREDIPIQAARRFLPQEAVDEYEAKRIEFSTPNPTYCWSPNCTSFIHAEQISTDEGRAYCANCGRFTCVECKARWHGSRGECPIQETLRMAEQEGWQRCPSCRNLIELSQGCHHMSMSTRYSINSSPTHALLTSET